MDNATEPKAETAAAPTCSSCAGSAGVDPVANAAADSDPITPPSADRV